MTGSKDEIRCLGRFVGSIDPGEAGELSRPGLREQSFGVAVLAHVSGSVDEDLEIAKPSGSMVRSHSLAVCTIRGDERDHSDHSGVGKQSGHLSHSTHVLGPIGRLEAQIGIQAVPEVVAVEQIGRSASFYESTLYLYCNRGLPRSGQTGQPHRRAQDAPLASIHRRGVPRDVPGQRRLLPADDHAGRHGALCDRVDQDETTGPAIAPVGIEHEWLLSSQPHPTDFIEGERVSTLVPMQRVDVEPVFENLDRCHHGS